MYVHNHVVPETIGPSQRFVLFLNDHSKPGWRSRKPVHPDYFSEQEFLDFITAMSRSKKPLASCYGWYALLYHEFYKRQKQGESMYDLYYDAVLLLDEIEKHKYGRLSREIKELLKKIEQCFAESAPQEVSDTKDLPDESTDRGKKQE